MKPLRKNETRVVIYSDLHCHMWQAVERPNRLEDFLQAIRCVNAEANSFGADAVIFAGDLFESKKSHDSRVWSKIFELLQLLHRSHELTKTKRKDFIYLAGNHDYNGDYCFLDSLRDNRNAFVFSGSTGIQRVGDYSFLFVPYGREAVKPNLEYNVMISHADFAGLRLTNGMKDAEQSISQRVTCQRFNRLVCFNGHIHVQQELKQDGGIPIVQIGPPLPLHWGDLYDETQMTRGCVLLRLWRDEKGKARYSYYRKPFDEFPRFYAAEDAALARKQDFVRQDNSQIAANVASTIDTARANVANMRPQDSLRAYLKMKNVTRNPKSRKRLLRIGNALYAKQSNIFSWESEQCDAG